MAVLSDMATSGNKDILSPWCAGEVILLNTDLAGLHCSLRCAVYGYLTGFGGALTTAGFAFSGSERSAHSPCAPRQVGCEPAGGWGCGVYPLKGGEPRSFSDQAWGESAFAPRRGRLVLLGLAGSWGAVCPGLVPWGLLRSTHRPWGGLGAHESQSGAEPSAAKASAALDSAFFPQAFSKALLNTWAWI